MLIRSLDPSADAAACDAIMRGLPQWFELEEGLAECARAVRDDDALVAVEGADVAGFATLRRSTPDAVEIAWLAVRRDLHRRGHGRALVEAVVARAAADGAALVTAWTLAPSRPDPYYAATRAFYARLGFVVAAEAEPWGPENPAILFVRSVAT